MDTDSERGACHAGRASYRTQITGLRARRPGE